MFLSLTNFVSAVVETNDLLFIAGSQYGGLREAQFEPGGLRQVHAGHKSSSNPHEGRDFGNSATNAHGKQVE